MVLYKCDKCGTLETSPGKMTDVQISHAGNSCVTYPRGGKYQVCKRCEQEILTMLHAWAGERTGFDPLKDEFSRLK